MFVARLRNCSDAPLHVLPVEFELCFGDVVVVLLDGLGIIRKSLERMKVKLLPSNRTNEVFYTFDSYE